MPGCTRCNLKTIMAPTTHNILLINSISGSIWGGLENWMELVGLGLAERGHKIHFIGRRGSRFLEKVSSHPEINVIPIDISGDFNPVTIKKIAAITRDYGIEISLCNFVKDVRLAGMARKLSNNYKIIWTPGVNLAKKSLSHKWLFSGMVDKAIVPSINLRDEIIASGYLETECFEVIPIGIDDSRWKGSREEGRRFLQEHFNLPGDAFVCLTSGRFVRQKGHCYLIEAARPLAAVFGNIYFVFLGDGPLEGELKSQIDACDLTDRFVFCGLLENHQRAVFGADLYVHPAIIEPYGIVLVEAMASALPVVATRAGGIPEVVEENKTALLVDPGVPQRLTNAVEQFYNDASMRQAFGQAGYERFVESFRMEMMIDRIEETLLTAVRS